jgi:transposase
MSTYSTTQPLFVGIDVGKNVHCYGAYVGLEMTQLFEPRTVHTSRLGYEVFSAWLRQQLASGCYDRIVVGLEPTGVYHEAWAYALHRDFGEGVDLRLVNPARTRQKRKQLQNRTDRKTDPVDAEALAHCLRDKLGRALHFTTTDLQEITLQCARFHVLKKERQRLANRLRTHIDRLWPGALVDVTAFKKAHPEMEPPEPLVATRALQRGLVLTVLHLDPNPYPWRARSPAEIQAALRATGLRCGPKTAQRVQRVAHNTMLLPRDLTTILAAHVRHDFARYERLKAAIAQLQARAETLLATSAAAGIADIPGLSAFLAAQYVAVVGDVERFEHADQVWALVGFDTVQNDSGDRRRQGKLTKRGEAWHRAVLYQMGFSASKDCPAIARAKARAVQRGKSKVAANLHAAHKVNRVCFHLYKHHERFDPAKSR